jgi:chromosome segregation ATPase
MSAAKLSSAAKLNAVLARLKQKFESDDLYLNQISTTINDLNRRIDDVQKLFVTLIAKLKEDIGGRFAKEKELENKIEQLQAEIEELNKKRYTGDETPEELMARLAVLQLQLETCNTEKDKYAEEINVLKDAPEKRPLRFWGTGQHFVFCTPVLN